jgi:hypothetical protein
MFLAVFPSPFNRKLSKVIQRDKEAFSILVAPVPPDAGVPDVHLTRFLPFSRRQLGDVTVASAFVIERNRYRIMPEQLEGAASDIDSPGLKGNSPNPLKWFLEKFAMSGLNVWPAEITAAVCLPRPVVFRMVAFVARIEYGWGLDVVSPMKFAESHSASACAFPDQ